MNEKRHNQVLVRCYFGMNSIRVAQALGFSPKQVAQVSQAYNSYSTDIVIPLVKGPYGTFCYSSLSGFYFDITYSNVKKAIDSLIPLIPRLQAVNRRAPLVLDFHCDRISKHWKHVREAAFSLMELAGSSGPVSNVWFEGSALSTPAPA